MTVLFAAGTFLHYVFGIALFLVAVFLILLVLVQRGRGGGLTGALGGMGGQSAFGAKAGDVFTRVTMVTAGIWIALCMGAIWMLNSQDEWQGPDTSNAGFTAPDTGDDQEMPPAGDILDTSGEGDSETSDSGDSIGGAIESAGDDASSDGGSISGGGDAAEAPSPAPKADESSADEPESES